MEPQNVPSSNTRSARKRRAKSPENTTEKALEEAKVLEQKRKITKKTKVVNEEVSTTTEEEKTVKKTVVGKKAKMEVETVEKTTTKTKEVEEKSPKKGRGGSKKADNNKEDEVEEEKTAKKGKDKSKKMEVEDEDKADKAEKVEGKKEEKKKRGRSKKEDKEDEAEEEESSKKKDKKKKEEKSPKKKSKSAKKGKKDDDSDEDDDKEEKSSRKKSKSTKGKKSKKESDSESDSESEEEDKKGKKKRSKSGKKGKKDDEKGEKKKRSGNKLNRNRAELVGLLEKYTPIEQNIELGDGKIAADKILISSWNVNALPSILKGKHLHNYMADRKPDIICLNETKLSEINIKGVGDSWIPEGYSGYFNCSKIRKWYSGTAIISKYKPISVKFDIGIDKHALEGRTITLEFENFYLVSTYVPNSGGHLVGVDYRVKEWDPDLRNYLNELKKKKHVIVCGDLNVVHEAIDIYNIENKEGWPGVSPGERKEFGELLNSGFVDTFRHLYPKEKQFSFYCWKLGHRKKGLGWRLDYFLVDKDGLVGVKDSMINNTIYGSDHVPIELELNPAFK